MFVVVLLRAIGDARGNTLDGLNSPEKMGINDRERKQLYGCRFWEGGLDGKGGEGWRIGGSSGNSGGASGCVSARTVCAILGLV